MRPMFWKKSKKENFETLQIKMYEEQVKKYENLDFIVATKKNKKDTIKYFIESEDNALLYKFQGLIYPEFHYELSHIVSSKMSGFTDDEILNSYYHLLRLGSWFKPNETNFELYKKAVERIVPDLEANAYNVCHLNRYHAYLILGVLNKNDTYKITSLSYDVFIEQREFVLKCGQFTHYSGMRKKRLKFIPFLRNKLIMERIRTGIKLFTSYKYKMTIGASITIMLLDENKISKETLINLHQEQLPNHFVWVLGSFYKEFQDTEDNKNLLVDLYAKYPKEWLDEYQREI